MLPPGARAIVYANATTPFEGALYALHTVVPTDGDSSPADNVTAVAWYGTAAADLRVNLLALQTAPAAAEHYTVALGLHNDGLFAAQTITLTYGAPLSSTLVNLPDECSPSVNGFACGINGLMAGEAITLTFGWQTQQPLVVQHTALAIASTPEQNTADNFALLQMPIGAADTGLQGALDTAVTQTSETFIYSVQVVNHGDVAIDGAQFVLVLPQSAVLNGYSGAVCATHPDAEQGVRLAVCSLNTLSANAAQEITLTLQFSSAGEYDLLGVLHHPRPDVNWLDNSTITALQVSTGSGNSRQLYLPVIFR